VREATGVRMFLLGTLVYLLVTKHQVSSLTTWFTLVGLALGFVYRSRKLPTSAEAGEERLEKWLTTKS
jgi:hypothetical protein